MPQPPVANPCQIDASDLAGVTACLRQLRWIAADEPVVAVARAGEGNMNCTLRATLAGRTLILKQSRPFVAKYPSIPAPLDRALVEARFYALVAAAPAVAALMPRLLHSDPDARLLCLEDLGEAADCTPIYDGARLDDADRATLLAYLSALHAIPIAGLVPPFDNREMRALNHEHIFRLPLSADAPDLDRVTPGLQRTAERIREDAAFVDATRALGERYLSATGPSLLHGDYFPGSWLQTATGVRIIDPEFGFAGPPELDLGVMSAHFVLARQPRALTGWAAGYRGLVDRRLVRQFAGVEITRRLLGVAQLPLVATLDAKATWLDLARRLVLDPDSLEDL